ncbi:MAG: cryptochrome/photolyase family protein [Microbacteriaceae bacterium]
MRYQAAPQPECLPGSPVGGRNSTSAPCPNPNRVIRAASGCLRRVTQTPDDTPLWLFADQLGPATYGGEHAHREVLLVAATKALAKRRYHRQKLHLVLSALKHAAHDLDDRATLIQADTYTDALHQFKRPVLVYEPTSHTGSSRTGCRPSAATRTPSWATQRTYPTGSPPPSSTASAGSCPPMWSA